MYYLLALITLLNLSFNLWAQEGGKKDEMKQQHFEKRKEFILKHSEERTKNSEMTKACMASAKTGEELRKCRQEAKQRKEQMHANFKNNREALKSEALKMREQKKAERNERQMKVDHGVKKEK